MFASYLAIERGYLERLLAEDAQTVQALRPSRVRMYEGDTFYALDGSTAVIDVYGVMSRQDSYWSYYYGGCSTERLRMAFAQAEADSAVRSIMLRINSPGGDVDGTAAMTEDLVALDGKKPVIAFVEGMACSAAYWLACHCREVWLESETTQVGSIGVITVRSDMTEMYAEMGIKKHIFASDELKADGIPGTPITEKQRNAINATIETLYSQFVSVVAKGRKIEEKAVRKMGAQVFIGQAVVENSLANGICNHAAAIARLNTLAGTSGSITRPGYLGQGQQEKTKMKHLLAGALALVGLHGMAGKVMAANGDDAESLAPIIAAHVNAEVERQVTEHPLLAALKAANITDASALTEALAHAKQYEEGIQSELQTEAIRALGQEEGMKVAASLASLPLASRKSMTEGYTTMANQKAGITQTAGGTRVSAAPKLPTAENAEATASSDKLWGKLTPEQQQLQTNMGIRTDEAREKVAAEILKLEGK